MIEIEGAILKAGAEDVLKRSRRKESVLTSCCRHLLSAELASLAAAAAYVCC